jgi:hypothetical protein
MFARIKRGNEEYFHYMKQDIKPYFKRAKALILELIKFAILITVPG